MRASGVTGRQGGRRSEIGRRHERGWDTFRGRESGPFFWVCPNLASMCPNLKCGWDTFFHCKSIPYFNVSQPPTYSKETSYRRCGNEGWGTQKHTPPYEKFEPRLGHEVGTHRPAAPRLPLRHAVAIRIRSAHTGYPATAAPSRPGAADDLCAIDPAVRQGRRLMARPGRKRKPAAPRYPNGKIRYDETDRGLMDVAKAQRLARGATEADWRHAEHECPLGRLRLSGRLSGDPEASSALYEAGVWYRALWLRMRAAIAAPSPTPGAMSFRLSGGPSPMTPDDVLRILARHSEAERAIPRAARRAVWDVVICEAEPRPDQVAPLVEALAALAALRAGEKNSQIRPSAP